MVLRFPVLGLKFLENAAFLVAVPLASTQSPMNFFSPPPDSIGTSAVRSFPAAIAIAIAIALLSVFPSFAAMARETVGELAEGKGGRYFVSPNGDDGASGDKQGPWQTIQKACESVEAGATITVLPGVYREVIYVEVEGSAEAGPVTIQGEGDVVIDVDGVEDAEHVFYIEDKSYLRIIGFEMRGLTTKDGSGIRFQGSGTHLQFLDNRIHGMRGKNAMGITVYGTSADEPVSELLIRGNEIFDCEAAPSEALVVNGNIDGFEISRNDVHDINNIGIDMIGGERDIVDDPEAVARNGICRENRVARANSNYGGGYGAGIYVDGARDIVIERNLVTECDLGIEVGAENKGIVTSGIVVRNNVLTGNQKAGLVFGGYGKKAGRVTGCQFLNNLVGANTNDSEAQAEVWVQWATDNVVRNNIVIGIENGSLPLLAFEGKDEGGNDFDYNRWHAPGRAADGEGDLFVWKGKGFASMQAYRAATGQGAHSSMGDPGLEEGGPGLMIASPCIDAGDPAYRPSATTLDITGGVRLKGEAVDLGAAERE